MTPPKVESDVRMADFLDINPEKKLYLSDAQIEHLKEKHNIDSFVVDTSASSRRASSSRTENSGKNGIPKPPITRFLIFFIQQFL